MVKNVSEVMLSSLPNFWKISKSFLEGKFKKVSQVPSMDARIDINDGEQPSNSPTGARRSPTQCRTMALDVVKLYISLISEFFTLSDMAVMTSPGGSNNTTPPLLPLNSNSLSIAHYLMKILGEMQESVNELNAMEISTEAASGLKNLLETAKWRFEDILINAWLRGEWFSTTVLPFTLCLDN